MIAIGEDNRPALRQLETCDRVAPSRQFAVALEPGRVAFVNFAAYRTGIHAETLPPRDEEIDHALRDIALLNIAGQLVASLESTCTGHPTREFVLQSGHHRQLYIHAAIVSHRDDAAALHAPTDPELKQIFSFLTRCHALS